MTTKLEQAARQALECLEDVFGKGKVDVGSINALREALAEQAEQDPVAWMYVNDEGECEQIEYGEPFNDPSVTPLCAAPVRTKDLTDDEIVEALGYDKSYRLKRWVLDDARTVIAADREKNK